MTDTIQQSCNFTNCGGRCGICTPVTDTVERPDLEGMATSRPSAADPCYRGMGEAARYALHVEKRLEAEVSVFTREISALRSRLAEYEKPVTGEEWENAIANLRMAQRYISHSSVPTPPLTAQMEQARTALDTIFNRMQKRIVAQETTNG